MYECSLRLGIDRFLSRIQKKNILVWVFFRYLVSRAGDYGKLCNYQITQVSQTKWDCLDEFTFPMKISAINEAHQDSKKKMTIPLLQNKFNLI